LYGIPTECGVNIKLVTSIKMCLNEICSRVWVGKHLSDMIQVGNVARMQKTAMFTKFKSENNK
jgi:hypothetical protein